MKVTANTVGKGWNWTGKFNKTSFKKALEQELDKVLKAVANYLLDVIVRNVLAKGTILGQEFAPLAEITKIKKKNQENKDKILIDTGEMINNLQVVKVDNITYMIGFTDPVEVSKAAFLEVGGVTRIEGKVVFVPGRPFLSPLMNKDRKEWKIAQNMFDSHIMNFFKMQGLQ